MSWYPGTCESLCKNSPAVDYYFVKNTSIVFCLCEVLFVRGGISEIRRGGRTFDGLGIQGHPDEPSLSSISEASLTE